VTGVQTCALPICGVAPGKDVSEQLSEVSSNISRTILKLSEKNSGVAKADVLSKTVEELTIYADNLLNRKVLLISIDNLTLDEAMKVLAEQASPVITKICFPTGQHGDISIAPDVKVSLSARNTTVAKVLEEITKQLSPNMPKIQWASFQGFNDVLFPVKGIRFFPLTAGKSGLKTQQQLEDDKLIGSTYLQSPTDRGVLAQFSQYAKAVNPRGQLETGQDGRPVAGSLDGQNVMILWRLTQVEPGKSPEKLTPEIRKQVVVDLKKIAAYELTVKAAQEVKTFEQLTAMAKAQKLKTIDTGLFARWTPEYGQYGNQRYVFTELKALKFENPATNGFFIEEVFSNLIPKDLDAKYPKTSPNAITVGLPCELKVVLGGRVDFRPALLPKFEKQKTKLVSDVMRREKFAAMGEWFQLESAMKRAQFTDQRFQTNQ